MTYPQVYQCRVRRTQKSALAASLYRHWSGHFDQLCESTRRMNAVTCSRHRFSSWRFSAAYTSSGYLSLGKSAIGQSTDG